SSRYGAGTPGLGSHVDDLPSQHNFYTQSLVASSQPDIPYDAFNSLSIGHGPYHSHFELQRHQSPPIAPIGTHSGRSSPFAPQRRLSSRLQDLPIHHDASGSPIQPAPWSASHGIHDSRKSMYMNGWAARPDHGFYDPRDARDPRMHHPEPYGMSEYGANGFNGYRGMKGGSTPPAQHHSLSPYLQPSSHMQQDGGRFDNEKLQKPPASALMLAFRRDPNALKTWTLKMIENHIAEFAGDQQGSRLIQSRLDGANSDDKMMVYNELRPNVRQFMNDIYANYIVQKLFDLMDMPHKLDLASSISGHMRRLSMHTYGCRVVQKSLEVLIDPQRAELIHELDGFVDKAIGDQNGNHVIQKAVEFIDNSSVDFIINFFRGNVRRYSKHAYGCRVVQRMLEHCKPTNLAWILQEIRDCAGELIRDTYGNYVVQHIIRRGPREDRKFFEEIIAQRMVEFSKHKYASNVVECAVKNTSSDKVVMFAMPLKVNSATLLAGMRDPYTNYVIQTLLETLRGQDREDFASDLRALFPKLKEKKETESINQKQITALEAHLFNPSYIPKPSVTSTSPQSYGDKAIAKQGYRNDAESASGPRADSARTDHSDAQAAAASRRDRQHARPSSLRKVSSISATALTVALDRTVHKSNGEADGSDLASGSSPAHATGNEPSYATDTTATTPSMTEAIPDVQTPLSSTGNSVKESTNSRSFSEGWRDTAVATRVN
ncbi:mRNA binding protein puf3, partial [Ascosphaera acerosa]